jgi:hypothetical protein
MTICFPEFNEVFVVVYDGIVGAHLSCQKSGRYLQKKNRAPTFSLTTYEDALNTINNWLSKCDELRQLDKNFDYTVRSALKYSAKNGNRPLKFHTLKIKNLMLYNLLKS